MNPGAAAWDALLSTASLVFTQPSFVLFQQLASAWVLCPGRRTVTRLVRVADPERRHAHDAFHRFLRAGAWNLKTLWRVLARTLVSALPDKDAELIIDLDDTLFHKSGRRVEGAGNYRDAVRSTARRVVYAWGLNLIVVTLRIRLPYKDEPLGLPIHMRLYRKGGPSHLDLAVEMLRDLAAWLPDRRFELACDGAYASLAGRELPRTQVTSRMRRDAALYELPPPRRKGQRGRPRKKGRRLPTPEELARRTKVGWRRATIELRGKRVDRLLLCRPVLWYNVRPDRQLLLVVVRDPEGTQPDDFFFHTNLEAAPTHVAEHYSGRWSIEDTFRNTKQLLGGQHPQSWSHQGPERAAALSFWIYSAVWHWYITAHGDRPSWPALPWYPAKRSPSFADALAALRRDLWRQFVFRGSGKSSLRPKTLNALIDALAYAAA